jgi:ribonucleoside-diphosphate reductase alpha chain
MSAAQRLSLTNEGAVSPKDAGGTNAAPASAENPEPSPAVRRRLPDERRALTHHFSIAGQEGYLTVGVYEDGLPGEIFITMAKQGSTISGLMDCFATAVSLALQYGVPLQILCGKFAHTRFEPSGWSGNSKIGYAKSIVDYIFRWLELKFTTGEPRELLFNALPLSNPAAVPSIGNDPVEALGELVRLEDAPACNVCGSLMMRSGTCYRCGTCGSTSGCS